MLLMPRGQRGTTSLGEYATTVALVVGAILIMTTYTKRTLQAHMRDARQYMIDQTSSVCRNDVNCMEAANLTGRNGIGDQYEPYYTAVAADVSANRLKQEGLFPTRSMDLRNETFVTFSNSEAQSNTYSGQAPPKNARTASDGVMMLNGN